MTHAISDGITVTIQVRHPSPHLERHSSGSMCFLQAALSSAMAGAARLQGLRLLLGDIIGVTVT